VEIEAGCVCDALPVDLIGMNGRLMSQVGLGRENKGRGRVVMRRNCLIKRKSSSACKAVHGVALGREWLPQPADNRLLTACPPALPQYIEFVADRLLVALGNPKVRCMAVELYCGGQPPASALAAEVPASLLDLHVLATRLPTCMPTAFTPTPSACPPARAQIYNVTNPFDWMEMISLQGKTNFFEKRVRPGSGIDGCATDCLQSCTAA